MITLDDILTAVRTTKEQNLEPKALKVCPSDFDRLRESVGLLVLDPALRERPLRVTEIMGIKVISDPSIHPDELWVVAERRHRRSPELVKLFGEVNLTETSMILHRIEPQSDFTGDEAVDALKKTRAELEKIYGVSPCNLRERGPKT